MPLLSRAATMVPNGRSLPTALAILTLAFAAPSQAGTQAATPAGTQAATPATSATADNETLVREAFDAWAAQRGNVFDLLAPDIRWTIHGSGPVAGTYDGVEDFLQRGAQPLVSRLSTPLVPQVHDIWAVGDSVIIRFDASATTTSGATYSNNFVWIFRMEEGAVVEAEAFLDLVAYQQVVDNNEPRSQ